MNAIPSGTRAVILRILAASGYSASTTGLYGRRTGSGAAANGSTLMAMGVTEFVTLVIVPLDSLRRFDMYRTGTISVGSLVAYVAGWLE